MAKFKIAKVTDWKQISGTCLQGNVVCDYWTLVNIFGNPEGMYDNFKSDAAWDVSINGVVCTIYNYKDGKNYLGAQGLDKEEITDWHIGGKTRKSAALVNALVDDYAAMRESISERACM